MVQFKGSILPLLALIATSATTTQAQNVANSSLAAAAPKTAEATPVAPAPAAIVPDSAQALRDEVTKLTIEREKIAAELALSQAKLDLELADKKANTVRLQADLAEQKAKQDLADFQNKRTQDADLAELHRKYEKISLSSNIAKAETETELSDIRHVENSTKRDIAQMWADMELQKQKEESRNYAMATPKYLENPLQGRKLILSDRCIPLNGVITMNTADQVIDRINYFNNRDRKMPIFIVIDDCPGGSVMAGYKILKAMTGSEAPVEVVVKSFAASMAACITTLAKKSYAYPNAVILHHQIAAYGGGNLTQQQEWMKEMEEWWKRLADPVAAKMGITRDEFIKRMYGHATSGDWNEFADNAQKLKWVDQIVDEIEETGLTRNPDVIPQPNPGVKAAADLSPAEKSGIKAQVDEKGRPYAVLPRLNPMDCYWLYNPDGYYHTP